MFIEIEKEIYENMNLYNILLVLFDIIFFIKDSEIEIYFRDIMAANL